LVRLFQKKYKFPEFGLQQNALLLSEGEIANRKIALVLPELFMNNSGKALKKLQTANRKLKTDNMIVLHDDLDLPLGKFKIVFNRGPAGHKGVESVRRALKSDAYLRVRIGISPKKKPSPKALLTFLISKFKPREEALIKKLSKKILEALEAIVTQGRDKAMSLYNR